MFGNWKTTLVGIGVAFLNLYAQGANPKNAALSIALGVLGAVSKDFNATGGSKPITHEAGIRVEKDEPFEKKP